MQDNDPYHLTSKNPNKCFCLRVISLTDVSHLFTLAIASTKASAVNWVDRFS